MCHSNHNLTFDLHVDMNSRLYTLWGLWYQMKSFSIICFCFYVKNFFKHSVPIQESAHCLHGLEYIRLSVFVLSTSQRDL